MVIPSHNPQLRNQPIAKPKQRLEMCELALTQLPETLVDKVVVSDIELERSGATYTYDTLQELRGFFPQDNFTIIIGSDAARQFGNWKRAKDIDKLAKILVVKRPGEEKIQNGAFKFKEVSIDAIDISATQIREKIAAGTISKFLPKSVAAFINEKEIGRAHV